MEIIPIEWNQTGMHMMESISHFKSSLIKYIFLGI